MSYDISIGDREFNYTYNLGGFFHYAIQSQAFDAKSERMTGLQSLAGMTGKQAAWEIGRAFDRLSGLDVHSAQGAARFQREYDAENGWGSTYGATILLANIMAACVANPRKRVSVT